jgi:SNF2 family DNA or RNA helicase
VDLSAFYLQDGIQFFAHQKRGVEWMRHRRHFIQGDDMGLGKTLQTLVVFGMDLKRKVAGSEMLVVVAPNSVVPNWYEEISRFCTFPATILGQVEGRKTRLSARDRKLQIVEFAGGTGPRALICSYEMVVKHQVLMSRLGFHMGIFDEVHKLQNPESQRTLACVEFSKSITRVAALTGTLYMNDVSSLWAPLTLVRAIDRSVPSFLNRHAAYETRTFTVKPAFGKVGDPDYRPAVTKKEKVITGAKRIPELRRLLYGDPDLKARVAADPVLQRQVLDDPDFRVRVYGRMIRRLKTEELDLPPVVKQQVWVDMHDKQRELYVKAIEEMEIETPAGDDKTIKDDRAKFTRLRQICGSTFDFTGEDYSAKLDRAIDLIDDIVREDDSGTGRKIIVFTTLRTINDLMVKRLREGRGMATWQLHGDVPARDRTSVIREWSEHEGPGVIVCGLQVTAEGLNMTAARDVIFLDKLLVPKLNDQAIDRANRIGQQTVHPVMVYEIITRYSVEVRVEDICNAKRDLFDTIVDERDVVKMVMKDVLDDARKLLAKAS